MPENHTPLSCFKIDGLKFAPKPTQKSQDFIKKPHQKSIPKCKRKNAIFSTLGF